MTIPSNLNFPRELMILNVVFILVLFLHWTLNKATRSHVLPSTNLNPSPEASREPPICKSRVLNVLTPNQIELKKLRVQLDAERLARKQADEQFLEVAFSNSAIHSHSQISAPIHSESISHPSCQPILHHAIKEAYLFSFIYNSLEVE